MRLNGSVLYSGLYELGVFPLAPLWHNDPMDGRNVVRGSPVLVVGPVTFFTMELDCQRWLFRSLRKARADFPTAVSLL
eukprot:m.117076 g.117076  ORF g.117076 m.117076 type:complete len:78 (+) comp13172_c0_seq7:229-462(+)